jgi:uncharacterized membrane protein
MEAHDAPRGVGEQLARLQRRFPYVGAQAVVLAAIALDFSLPDRLTLGPPWLMPVIETLLLTALLIGAPRHGEANAPRRRRIAIGLIALISAVNAFSLALLAHYLLHGRDHNGRELIIAGSVLWLTNVLLFGLWYWELDRGGPLERRTAAEGAPDFLFPQMATPELHQPDWEPALIDYLYVSFTNATAFSPTDTMPLTQSAKVLMSSQALISLITVGLVVARAVNILT